MLATSVPSAVATMAMCFVLTSVSQLGSWTVAFSSVAVRPLSLLRTIPMRYVVVVAFGFLLLLF